MVFRSKVDRWLRLVLLAGALAALAGAVHALRSGSGWLAPALIATLGAALPLWILLSTKYTVSAGQVLAQSGPFRWCIPAARIIGITRTQSAFSSPALSLDRLRIEYASGRSGKKTLLVSPVDPDAFVRAVEAAKSAD